MGAGIFRELHAAVIPVGDIAQARAFYEGVLGLEPRKIPNGDFMVIYRTGTESHLCVYRPYDPEDERPGYEGVGGFPNFRSDDIEATHKTLLEHEVECSDVGVAGSLKWFQFRDPFGNRLDVCQYGGDWMD